MINRLPDVKNVLTIDNIFVLVRQLAGTISEHPLKRINISCCEAAKPISISEKVICPRQIDKYSVAAYAMKDSNRVCVE